MEELAEIQRNDSTEVQQQGKNDLASVHSNVVELDKPLVTLSNNTSVEEASNQADESELDETLINEGDESYRFFSVSSVFLRF